MNDGGWLDWFKNLDAPRTGIFLGVSAIGTAVASYFSQMNFFTEPGHEPGFLDNWITRPITLMLSLGAGLMAGVFAVNYWAKNHEKSDAPAAPAPRSGASDASYDSPADENPLKGLVEISARDTFHVTHADLASVSVSAVPAVQKHHQISA